MPQPLTSRSRRVNPGKSLMVFVLALSIVGSGFADCWVMKVRYVDDPVECDCSLFERCPTISRGGFLEDYFVWAESGEAGVENWTMTRTLLGHEYPCRPELSEFGLFICSVSNGVCTWECATMAPTGVGLAACFTCLTLAEIGCASCSVMSCEVDYTAPSPVYGFKVSDSSGDCTGVSA